jgi:hypothetical protein
MVSSPTEHTETKKNFTGFYILAFLLGLFGVIGLRYIQVHQFKNLPKIPQINSQISPTPEAFVYHPPSTAVKGLITVVSGSVQKSFWDKDDLGVASVAAEIFQGEKLVTDTESTASANFEKLVEINLDSSSDVRFTSLIPTQILFTQPTGLVTYTLTQTETPISVRSLGLLIKLNSGAIRMDSTDSIVTIVQLSGQSQIAFESTNYVTQHYELKEKDRATYNDYTQTIRIR